MLTFAAATAVEDLDKGEYHVDLRQEYAVGGRKPNGGYVLACLGRAALAAAKAAGSPHEHVVAAGAQYLTAPALGAAVIETQVLRAGRMVTQLTASLISEGRLAVQARFTLAALPSDGRPYWGGDPPVALPPLDECSPNRLVAARGITIRLDPATSFEWTTDGPHVTGGGEFRAWFRDDEQDVVDTVGLLFAADCLPPATAGVVPTGWVPTLDLSAYVRALPAPGPLRLRFRAQLLQDDFADEVCEAWDSAGRLVLQATQLAALRLPDGPRHRHQSG